MTSKLTRERLEALANAEYCKSNPGAWLLGLKEVNELARMALAAMNGEPVAYMVRRHNEHDGTGTLIHAEFLGRYQERGDFHYTPLYRHAQPVPVVPEEKLTPNTLSMYAVDAVAAIAEVNGWNACRAAMLNGGKS
ncbi:hypothetical protein [Klebsiella pneumoniae]|uniref:hypothetical protein n=1 Tax=Klebsiella pneumoniae TaxID=573 RepID=UPI001BAC9CEC|nr:hypothetical protein [Klebsiella pneumoniae]MBR7262598.1 hypothetical protein [Klebsiella pneumoniae]